MQNLQINDKFKRLLDPLTQDERDGLEQSILADGCRDPLVVWNGILIDGHNRYEICRKYNVPFQVSYIEFKNENEARIWIIRKELTRRNLSPDKISYLRGALYLTQKQIDKETMAEFTKKQRGLVSNGLRYDVMKRDGFKCKMCGLDANDGIKLVVDHINPIANGGKTEMNNLQTLCWNCNSGKSDKE